MLNTATYDSDRSASPTSSEVLPLSMVDPGKTVELVEICANCKLRKRLIDLGLNTGQCIRVLQSDGSAPMLLAVTCDSRLALGKATAHHIYVRYAEGERL